ncbi:MAG: hypothetical protein IKP43_09215 [Bacteroidaceae bacterium]|nr:hypothetical protein [Bacteroidaceae bacterium]
MDKNTEQETAKTAKNIDEQIRDALREAQAAFGSRQTDTKAQGSQDGESVGNQEEPAWFRKYRAEQEKLYQQLRKDNDTMKAEKRREEESAIITSAAERVGIPKYLVEHLKIDAEGNVEQQLTHIKQKMVNHSLLPIDSQCKTDNNALLESEADEWAKTIEH